MAFIDPKLVPKRKLSNGQEIPCIGMGTFGSDRFSAEQVSNAVAGAIRSGYRLFDCASVYGNEDLIGQVFEDAMKEGVVKREELFITSKVWNDMHGQGDVLLSCAQTLKDLRLDYLDFYFVHWPFPNYHAPGCDGDSRNPDSKPFSVEEFMSTWRQMERLVDMGLVKNIGMSSMTIPKLEAVLCSRDPAHRLLSHRQPHPPRPGYDARRYRGYPGAGAGGSGEGPRRASRGHLPEMGGAARPDPDPVLHS